METVIAKIREMEDFYGLSKHEQLVQGISNAIDEGILVKGNSLPSVNNMVDNLGFARKTIVKAYHELKERGIIQSRKRLGYFVTNDDTQQVLSVALVLYAFHTFQEIFYNTFRESLGEHVHLDVFFHHNNPTIYQTILDSIEGQYGMYVIAPVHGSSSRERLRKFSPKKLLLVDRYENVGADYAHICQEFRQAAYTVFTELASAFRQYEELVLFYKEGTDYPQGIKTAFDQFCLKHDFAARSVGQYKPGILRRNTAYITIGDIDLWGLLKDCREEGFELGKDVGILSANDTPVKEIISGGISTFYVDFEDMAQRAAQYVLDRELVQEILPTRLIRRASL
ncbi:MAG: GntR family transcriptional regulator [Bacteroidota bacterium]